MKKFMLLCFVVLFTCCTPDYNKDIIGMWVSDDNSPSNIVSYTIRESGIYKKRMKGNFYGAPYDWTERGTWEIKGSTILFKVETFNGKPQSEDASEYEIYYLKNKKLVLETKDGKQYVYINTD